MHYKGQTCTWEYWRGCKRKKVRTTSDDAGGKSVSEKSKSDEGGNSAAIRNNSMTIEMLRITDNF